MTPAPNFDEETSLKEHRDALRQERQLFLQGPVVVLQRKGTPSRLSYVSENFQTVFGLDPGPYLRGERDLWERFHDDDREALGKAWQTIVDGQAPGSSSGRFRFRVGDGRWKEIAFQMVFDRGGPDREQSTLAYWLDRTEEAHLLRRLSLTLEAARAGTWEWNSATGRVQFDAAWAVLLGHSAEDLKSMTFQKWTELVHPSDLELWIEATDNIVRGQSVGIDLEIRQRLGSDVWGWFQIRGKVFESDSEGRPLRILGTQEDVTDKMQAEEERAALSQVVEQSPNAVILTDLTGAIEYVNREFTTMSGYELFEVQGQNPRIWKSPLANPHTYREMWSVLAAGQPWFGEFHNHRKDGTSYWVQAIISPLKDSSGRVFRYAGQQIDITARKAVDASLKEAQDEAEAANQAKSDFLAQMSHEIRTPMTGILGMADLALSRPIDAEARRQLESIKLSGENLLSLLNDILDVSKIEAGMMELESVPFSVREMMEATVSPLRVLSTKKGLGLEVEMNLANQDFRTGDPTRLRQILTNLVGNAIKFTARGNLTVSATAESDAVMFSVRDTGPGVSPDRRHRLFQRFSQAETSTTRNFGGTGLGLEICRQLVERMGGQIGYKDATEPPGGIFWFTVPLLSATPPVPPTVTAGAESSPSRKSLRLLVVEDNPVSQQVAVGLLGRWDVIPDVVSNGAEALKILNEKAFDLVFMDVQMPVMDGLTAVKAMRSGRAGEASRHIPVIAMTANAMGGDREACFEAGMNDYVTKPISVAKFSTLLKKWELKILSQSAKTWDVNTFNVVEMQERLQLDDALIAQIARLFLSDLPARRQALTEAVGQGQTPVLLRLAHTVKGTASNLVAQSVVTAAQALELAALSENHEETQAALDVLLMELDRLEDALTHFSDSVQSSPHSH